jgi:hypothetical protein
MKIEPQNEKMVVIAPAGMGLDLTRPEEISEEEKQRFKQTFLSFGGRPHLGLNFWLDNRIDILKRYRIWSGTINQRTDGDRIMYNPNGYGFVYLYGMTGYAAGVKYIIHMEQQQGFTKEQVHEGIAAAFIWLGPRGMETVAQGLSDYEWIEPKGRPAFPDNWKADPDAFKSGLDFSTPDLSDTELERIKEWYLRVEGEIPPYVGFLTAHGRRLLKAYRQRFENTLKVLPKQIMPYLMLHIDVMRGNRDGIREGVLLARGFGMTKAQTLEAISWGMFYGGVESGSITDEAASDILDGWKERASSSA